MAVGDRLAGFNDVNLKEPGMKVMHGELCADYNAAQEKLKKNFCDRREQKFSGKPRDARKNHGI